ncbi:MAG: hypothetical protein M1828_001767 [Chrysothrix sp. TS-e1954]|nr:MAG: hypothetical protein M1828_001767 [Chrysothrix sp. TS-e1954]
MVGSNIPVAMDADEDLTDDQIEALLQQAEARIRSNTTTFISETKPQRQNRPRRSSTSTIPEPYVTTTGQVAHTDPSRLLAEKDRKLSDGFRKLEDPVAFKQRKLAEKRATAGPNWYNLPRTDVTPELKRDLQLLRMRNVLDPKRHYKKDNSKPQIPEFSQVGTLIEGPTEYYSARLQKRERKRTLVEEVLSAEQDNGRFKHQYNEIQEKKRSGKKGYHKAQMKKRYGRRYNG